MVVIEMQEFVQSQDEYFRMARAESVMVRQGSHMYEIHEVEDDNPSPSGDPYFADPVRRAKVIADVRRSEQQYREGKFVRYTPELKQKWFGNV